MLTQKNKTMKYIEILQGDGVRRSRNIYIHGIMIRSHKMANYDWSALGENSERKHFLHKIHFQCSR